MSLRARLRLSIVALVTIVVVAISLLYLYDFTDLAFKSATARAYHIADHVKGYVLDRVAQQMAARGSVPLTLEESKRTWAEIVKTDPYIRQMLERTLAIADVVVSIHISGEDGTTLAASSLYLVGGPAPVKANFRDIEHRNPILNMWDLFRKREDYIITLPLGVPEQRQPIFNITVVIRSVLLANALSTAYLNFGMVFVSSLVIALFLASVLPNLVLSPLERVSQRIDLIRTGEFEAIPLGIQEESREFADVQSKLSLLGQQFRGARQDALELRDNIDDLLQKLEEAVLLFDPSGRLMMAGNPVSRLLGKDREELIGHKLGELFPSSTVLGALIHSAIERHQPVHDQLVTLGPEINAARLLVNVEILQKGPNREMGTLITLRDAETRRQLELQLDVSSRLAAISRLTGGIAHEIKNPLNAMALHLEVLKTKLDAAEPEIDVIAREIKRLDHVVKTFLNFNRPIELQRHPLNLAELASDLVDLVRPDAERKNIRIETAIEERMWINGDTDLLRQAVLNVVVNAIDAMKDSGTLTVRGEQTDRECVLIVADTGAGIPPQIRDKIFNLYFTTKENGSGIGLAMTFRAVQLHSGTIDFASEPENGTSFRLRFSRADVRGLERAAGMTARLSATVCMLALSSLNTACKKNKVATLPPAAPPAPTAPKPKPRQSAANPAAAPAPASVPAAPASAPVLPAPAAQPRLGQMLSPAEQSRYNALIDQSLGNARGNLALIGSRSLTQEQQTTLQQIQNFVQQAQDTRKVDLLTAKGLADKAEVLSRDLARSLR